jgi:hypothetical protein
VRRACTLFEVARSALSYQGRKAAKDTPDARAVGSIHATAIAASASFSGATVIA